MYQKDIQFLLDHGLLSELDIHFARLITRISGQESPGLFLAAALVSRATSEGPVSYTHLTLPTSDLV